jgi:hypothetical protein
MPVDPQMVARGALVAGLPSWWDRLRAKAKIIGTAMTSRHDKVMTVSNDGRRIELVDADEFSDTQRETGGPEAKAPAPNAGPKA